MQIPNAKSNHYSLVWSYLCAVPHFGIHGVQDVSRESRNVELRRLTVSRQRPRIRMASVLVPAGCAVGPAMIPITMVWTVNTMLLDVLVPRVHVVLLFPFIETKYALVFGYEQRSAVCSSSFEMVNASLHERVFDHVTLPSVHLHILVFVVFTAVVRAVEKDCMTFPLVELDPEVVHNGGIRHIVGHSRERRISGGNKRFIWPGADVFVSGNLGGGRSGDMRGEPCGFWRRVVGCGRLGGGEVRWRFAGCVNSGAQLTVLRSICEIFMTVQVVGLV